MTRYVPARLLRAFALLFLPLFGVLTAQHNLPVVAGHFAGQYGDHSFEATFHAVKLNSGQVVGWLSWEHTFDDGSPLANTRTVDAKIDELAIVGNQAFLRAGTTYIALQDGGEGSGAAPDLFTSLYFLSSPSPPLAVFQNLLGMTLPVSGREVLHGQVQIRP